jgi:hypothetical protein
MVNSAASLPDCSEICLRSLETRPFERALVWSSDRGFDHVAIVLQRYPHGDK